VAEARILKKILDVFCKATCMVIHMDNSNIIFNNCSDLDKTHIKNLFPTRYLSILDGLKYMGFQLKMNCYKKEDWAWLIKKIEA
jgi:hypothetical protein